MLKSEEQRTEEEKKMLSKIIIIENDNKVQCDSEKVLT